MNTIAIIIPFYQREKGILVRALKSIDAQILPEGWNVDIIIVDDGSPVSAESELETGTFRFRDSMRLIVQKNSGVAAARNRGLDEISPLTRWCAFLDSDDIWPPEHLGRAIGAFSAGFDFCFTDNHRDGHHEAHCRSIWTPIMASFLEQATQKNGYLPIPKDLMLHSVLCELPCQASTVVYKFDSHRDLRFHTVLKSSGEDVLFFTRLVAGSQKICLDLDSIVECGGGLNIYFGNLDWDGERFLAIKTDGVITHSLIAKEPMLSVYGHIWNKERREIARSELGFHVVRRAVKTPGKVLKEFVRLLRLDPASALLLPFYSVKTILTKFSAAPSDAVNSAGQSH